MVFKPPEVLEILWGLTLRNGNIHRLQLVRFSDKPNSVVSLECREYVAPENFVFHRGPKTMVSGEGGFGMGLTKGLRAEHVEWIVQHREKVRALMHKQRIACMRTGLDAFGRKV